MTFHRLSVPSYTGGLPGGYDYINNAVSGTPANVAGVKVGGINDGSYFVAYQDPATSAVSNRASYALAQNCDTLDDYLHRDIAIPTIAADVVAVGPVSSITLTGPGIFIGSAGTPNTTAGIHTFVEITNQNGVEIVDASQVQCVVTAITGGTVGTGFSSGNITLTVSPPIPNGVTYRVYYGTRGNLATLPADALTSIKIRNAQEVSAELEAPSGAALIGFNPTGLVWADTSTFSPTTVQGGIAGIVTDLAAITGAALVGMDDTALAWADAVPFIATTVQGSITALITNLSSTSGSAHIGGSAFSPFTGVPNALAAAPIASQLQQLTTLVNPTARAMTTNISITAADANGLISTTLAGAASIQLPDPTTSKGLKFDVADNNSISVTNTLTFVPFAAESINGAATYVYSVPNARLRVECDGTNWLIFDSTTGALTLEFLGTGTFVGPYGYGHAIVEGCGGGGGGAGGAGGGSAVNKAATGGGGGGGAPPISYIVPIIAGQSYTATIGAGGAGGGGGGALSNGGFGGDGVASTFAVTAGATLATFPGGGAGYSGIFIGSASTWAIAPGGACSGNVLIQVVGSTSSFSNPYLLGLLGRRDGEGGASGNDSTQVSGGTGFHGCKSTTGFLSGALGPVGVGQAGPWCGGGPGGGGGGGPFGAGGPGGSGGGVSVGANLGVSGVAGTDAAANSGAGGGGGGGGGDSAGAPTTGGAGGGGGSGRIRVTFVH